ncbi:MAG: nucleotide exchange factor GrpE [Verrucomicrobia bacterium Tous-C9LFEB]|nr:MAG: nucleotide exchange factor GrpE [Verrucomicrobia bacterium Tous-C9LFEB]
MKHHEEHHAKHAAHAAHDAAATPADAPATGAAETPAPEAKPTEPVTLTADDFKKLQDAAAQAEALRDRLLRTQADWDNYRKRAIREKEEAVRYAAEGVMEKLLPILDSFEMGLQAAKTATEAAAIAQGMQMIYTQFQNLLKDVGVETIDAVGHPFDPHRHEALGHQESAEHEEGTVVGQMRKGYKLKDRLLRPASVFVAKKSEGQS